ncbi:transcription factor HHO3-like [Primulina tabacum]|uniref:transcription factor HHO3-like n=1 Tax=Primulina tabacum TaxID=48773 RepID=UPI003F5A5612
MIINTLDHSDFSEKMQRFQDYIQALQEERDKIQVFRRELPLCFELVTQAIETCKHQFSGTTTECNLRGQSECSEQTSCPVFEEFIPLKRASSHSDGEEQESQKQNKDLGDISNTDGKKNGNEKNSKKSDWLRSVQLWNQAPDPSSKEDSPRKVVVTEVKRNGGAFQPFKKEKSLGTSGTPTAPTQVPKNKSPPPASASSTADSGGGGGRNKKEDKEGESLRKARRCWSPELHRRFVQSLHQLGGSHVATPKQIRELMKVDGLTNDEVKSHLQKYRLHTRRHSPSNQNNNNAQQTPQFVVVGGIWVPPEYAAAMAKTTTSGDAPTTPAGIYAPVASLAQPFREASASPKQRQLHSGDSGSHSGEGGVHSHSPATSSSTHTTTASPSY